MSAASSVRGEIGAIRVDDLESHLKEADSTKIGQTAKAAAAIAGHFVDVREIN